MGDAGARPPQSQALPGRGVQGGGGGSPHPRPLSPRERGVWSGIFSGVQPNLNMTIVKETSIPLPSLDEQRRIVAEVERRLEETVEVNLRRLSRLRGAILKAAFEGSL